ncbi:MAG: hypothetical protein ACTSUB_01345 [Candidatus Thorarchaeota archaeon]
MAKDKEEFTNGDRDSVVDQLLSEMGVDAEMKKELVDSGRISSDIVKVATGDQIRRHLEIEKSTQRLRDSMNLVERNIMNIDDSIDKIERELVPVVLSFLIGLKGKLVGLKTDVITKSKRQAKTNLQASYVETVVKDIFDEEFAEVEGSLTTEVSTPILEKVREITDSFKSVLQLSLEELTTLKARTDDFTQRTTTELEFQSKELSLKPKVEVPKEVQDQLKELKREVEKLTHGLQLESQKLENRDAEIIALQKNLAATKERNENLEESLEKMKTSPTVDTGQLIEIRQSMKVLEASKLIADEKLNDAEEQLKTLELRNSEIQETLDKRELEVADIRGKKSRLETEIAESGSRFQEMDELRARIRSLESGDNVRELERTRNEFERLSANMDRLTTEYKDMQIQLTATEFKLNSYIGVMGSTEKTKAFLIIESNEQMTLREIGRAFGVAPATVMKWAEDFERLGIAKIIDGTTIECTKPEAPE